MAVDAFFKSQERVEAAFARPDTALDEMGRLRADFEPIKEVDYFIHVDLAQKHDHAAVGLAHVSGWGLFNHESDSPLSRGVQPEITVDLIKHWTPRTDQPIDLKDVYNFILDVHRQGFKLKLVTFDRWNSTQTIEDLKSYGIKAEILSVALPHYTDFLIAVNEGRVSGPQNELLTTEMLQLRIMKANKVDHPRKGSKDLSDAVAGAIFNAAKYSVRGATGEIEVFTIKAPASKTKQMAEGTIVIPRRAPEGAEMPDQLAEFLRRMTMI
jgi:phage terminase large subunit-like protein